MVGEKVMKICEVQRVISTVDGSIGYLIQSSVIGRDDGDDKTKGGVQFPIDSSSFLFEGS